MFGLGPIGGAVAALATVVILSVTPDEGIKAAGTSVSIKCLNVAAAATVLFGSSSATGVSVSGDTITCSTPVADSVYMDDVTITNSSSDINTRQNAFDRISSGDATSTDPATLAMTGFWEDYGGSTPWAGTASLGSSGSNPLTNGPWASPSSGTALNGHATAAFNGTTQALQSTDTTAVMLGPESLAQPGGVYAGSYTVGATMGWSSFHLVKFTSLPTDLGYPYSNTVLLTSASAVQGVGVSSDAGAQGFQISANDDYPAGYVNTPSAGAIPATGAYVLIQARWTGMSNVLELRLLNGSVGSWQGVECRPPAYPASSDLMRIGVSYSGTVGWINGSVATMGTVPRALSSTTLDGVALWAQTRYSLSLGVTINYTGTGTGALSSLSASGSGGQTFTGVVTGALSPLTGAGTGAETFTGTGTAAQSSLTAAETGAETFTGTGTSALSPLTAAETGSETFTGTATAAASPLTAAETGALTFTGTATAACSPLTSSCSGALTFTGTGSGACSPLAGAATGSLTFTGTGTGACSPLTAAATGALTFTGSGSGALSPLTASATGTIGFTGTCSAGLSPLAADGSSEQTFAGNGSGTVSPFSAAITGTEDFTGIADVTLSPLAASGTGIQGTGNLGMGSASIAPLEASGSGTYTPLGVSGIGTADVSPLGCSGSCFLVFSGTGYGAFSSFTARAKQFNPGRLSMRDTNGNILLSMPTGLITVVLQSGGPVLREPSGVVTPVSDGSEISTVDIEGGVRNE